jgi:hypothetical protein
MFLIRGTRTARIKTYIDNEHQCNDCKDFDLKVKVYKDYFHVFFIPIFATGIKSVKIRCNKCTEPFRSDSLQKEYERRTRTPFWLYTGILLVGLLVTGGFSAAFLGRYLDSQYVAHPRPGDVYTLHREDTFYDFVKVIRVNGDSVITYNNNMRYVFTPSALESTDYFVADREVVFTKELLHEMLEKGVIDNVARYYSEASGFQRSK